MVCIPIEIQNSLDLYGIPIIHMVCISDQPKQYFIILPEPNRTSQLKFCLPNRTEQNQMHEKLIKKS